jgi:hypothetical protein
MKQKLLIAFIIVMLIIIAMELRIIYNRAHPEPGSPPSSLVYNR